VSYVPWGVEPAPLGRKGVSRLPGRRRHDRRYESRIKLEVPVRVHGQEQDGTVWEELTAIDDASSDGVSFVIRRQLEKGRVLRLVTPFPKSIRKFDESSPAYTIYGLVRKAQERKGEWRIGVQFLGKEPPRGFDERPWAPYLLPWDVEREPPAAASPRPKEPDEDPTHE